MISESYDEYDLTWHGIPIKIAFNKAYSPAFKQIQGFDMTHIKISRQTIGRLPITGKDGFRSRFISETAINEYGNVLDYVTAWLNHEAQSKDWKTYEQASRQLTLF